MSILDFEHNTLCPEIWDKEYNLKPGVKNFIYNSLEMFFFKEGISEEISFIKGVLIASSLATYYYTDISDLDVKVLIDIPRLKKNNTRFSFINDSDICEFLVDKGRESSWLTSIIPGTGHVLDVYFIDSIEFTRDKYIKYDSLYSLSTDKWLKFPQKIDTKGNPAYILNQAKQKAKDYLDQISLDISQARRDVLDFYILMDYLKSLDDDEIFKFYDEIQDTVDDINNSVGDLLKDREMLKLLRKETFNKKELDSQLSQLMGSLNYSDGNLIYKLVQRYGYMRILTDLKNLFKNKKITVDKIKDVDKILNNDIF